MLKMSLPGLHVAYLLKPPLAEEEPRKLGTQACEGGGLALLDSEGKGSSAGQRWVVGPRCSGWRHFKRSSPISCRNKVWVLILILPSGLLWPSVSVL